ncbi:hypothetical protein F4776DRAFT_65490 [Hypoxylon sp. NC0597]|nr:hypothetical protein F4776DRAFT_65490 [Hypoxylon sp. NC0597]
MAKERGSTLRKEAKAMANDRRLRKEKHRKLRQWVYDMFKSNPADKTIVDPAGSGSEASSALPHPGPSKGGVWDRPIYINGQPGPRSLTIGHMLRFAKDCYEIAKTDFDKMNLYDHMYYIQAIREPDIPPEETLVDKNLIILAQQQLYLAKTNYAACVVRLAIISNLPKDIKMDVKTCQNCLQKFMHSPTPCTCARTPGACAKLPCEFHWGKLKSHNDQLDEVRQKEKLGEDFLTRGKVRLREFKLWMGSCYWSCCEGKLEELGPDAGKRSQRRKHEPLQMWEIPNDYDGKVGCPPREEPPRPTDLVHHVPF